LYKWHVSNDVECVVYRTVLSSSTDGKQRGPSPHLERKEEKMQVCVLNGVILDFKCLS
jgi:hypothetical protein